MSQSAADIREQLIRAARQAAETDQLLAGGASPRGVGPELPELAPPAGLAGKTSDATPASGERSQPLPAVATTPDQKRTMLEQIDRDEVQGCTRCGLCEGRTNTVFGDGDPAAELMFIGEGPGADEDAQGLPFVGRAGQLLNKMIVAMGLSRESVYIANVVKCRPPGNRAPMPEEAQTCWNYLQRQIQIIQPKAIVVLGNAAAKMLLETRTGITRLRGNWHEVYGIPVMPTFHPAYLLRQYTEANRRKVWSDLQAVMEKLGLNKPKS